MRRLSLIDIVVCTALITAAIVACVPPSSLQTPAGRAAFTANQVLQRVGELQNAAITANATINTSTGRPLLATATTRRVVQSTVAMAKILRETPNGWPATLRPAFNGLRDSLSPDEELQLGPYLGAIDALIALTETH